MHGREAGYSLLEVLTVIGLTAIISSVAIIQVKTTLSVLDADKAANLVQSQFTYALQMAVNQRRNVEIGFLGDDEIKVTRYNSDSSTTVLSDVTLPSGYTFGLATGAGDTPEGYGCGAAVSLNAGTGGTFLGNGTFVDTSSVLLNGCVFTIGSGNGSARAVTVSGSSGKVKRYALQSTTWVAQ